MILGRILLALLWNAWKGTETEALAVPPGSSPEEALFSGLIRGQDSVPESPLEVVDKDRPAFYYVPMGRVLAGVRYYQAVSRVPLQALWNHCIVSEGKTKDLINLIRVETMDDKLPEEIQMVMEEGSLGLDLIRANELKLRIRNTYLDGLDIVIDGDVVLTNASTTTQLAEVKGFIKQRRNNPQREALRVEVPPLHTFQGPGNGDVMDYANRIFATYGLYAEAKTLARSISLSSGLNLTHDEELTRQKRFIPLIVPLIIGGVAAGGGLATGVSALSVGIPERQRLRNRIDGLEKDFEGFRKKASKFIALNAQSIERLKVRVEKESDRVSAVVDRVTQNHREFLNYKVLSKLVDVIVAAEHAGDICLSAMRTLANIFMSAQDGKLHVNAVTEDWLIDTYDWVRQKADDEGMSVALKNPTDILSSPTSFFIDDGEMVLLSNIPVFNPLNRFNLYRYKPFPFETEVGQFAYFHPSKDILGVSVDKASFQSYSLADLQADCKKDQYSTYLCPDNLPAVPRAALHKADPPTRCLGTMYLNKVQDVMTACNLESINPFHSMLQLDNSTFFLSSPEPQVVTLACSDDKTYHANVGLISMIKIHRTDCQLTTDTFVTHSVPTPSDILFEGGNTYIELTVKSTVKSFLETAMRTVAAVAGHGLALDTLEREMKTLNKKPGPDDNVNNLPVFTWDAERSKFVGKSGVLADTIWSALGFSTKRILEISAVVLGSVGLTLVSVYCCCKAGRRRSFNTRLVPDRSAFSLDTPLMTAE